MELIPSLTNFEWQKAVIGFETTPPASPSKGDRYIIGDSAVDDWSGHDGDIVYYGGSSWVFVTPADGWVVFSYADGSKFISIDGAWTLDSGLWKRTGTVIEPINDGDSVMAYSVLYSPIKVPDSYTYTERITDGSFELWNTIETPDSWSLMSPDGSAIDATKYAKDTDSHAGTYAIQQEAFFDFGGVYISNVLQQNFSLANDDTLQVTAYGKNVSGSSQVAIIYQYRDGSNDSYAYNFTGVDAGTWTAAPMGPSSDQIYLYTNTSSYGQATPPQATLPSSGVSSGEVILLIAGGNGDVGLIDDVEILVNSSDVATNGGFENWSESADQSDPLEEFVYEPGGDWNESYIAREESSVQAGSYAVKIQVEDGKIGQTNRGYIYQSYSADEGTEMTVSVYTKTTNSKTPYLILLDDVPNSHSNEWDFTAEEWSNDNSDFRFYPGSSFAQTLSGTSSWVKSTEKVFTMPASGTVYVVLLTDDGDSGPNDYYFDVLSMKETVLVPGNSITAFENYNESNFGDLESDDVVIDYYFEGDDTHVYYMDKDGKVYSDLVDGFDFSNQPLRVADPTDDDEAENKGHTAAAIATALESTEHLLDTASDIDAEAGDTATFFTGEAGKEYVITKVVIKPRTVTNWSGEIHQKAGTNAGHDNWNDDVIANPTAEGTFYIMYPKQTTVGYASHGALVSEGDTFYVEFFYGTADALVVDIEVFGYSINV